MTQNDNPIDGDRPELIAAREQVHGNVLLPTDRGTIDVRWLLTEGSKPSVIAYPVGTGPLIIQLNLGPKALVAAALRSLARDIEAAPAWSADAPIEPAAAEVPA